MVAAHRRLDRHHTTILTPLPHRRSGDRGPTPLLDDGGGELVAPRLICAAAQRLFSTKGYIATSIAEIAAEAGVARPTVFAAIGPKPLILKAVVDQAMAGDDAPVPVATRPWFTEAFDEPDPARSLDLHVRNICWMLQRVVPLLRAMESAAAVDEEAAALWADFRRQRRTGTAGIAANLAAKTRLRCRSRRSPTCCSLCRQMPTTGWSTRKAGPSRRSSTGLSTCSSA